VAFGRMRRKVSDREHKRKVNAALEFLGVPIRNEIKPKRERASNGNGASTGALEKDVLHAVGQFLAAHPRVLLAVRQNSGAAHYESNGKAVPIWFYKLVKNAGEHDITLTDYWGFLRDGRPFAIECKRESWRSVSGEREKKQQAFIHLVEAIGGRGGFVRNVNDAEVILGDAHF
jgi:hypothetical protein